MNEWKYLSDADDGLDEDNPARYGSGPYLPTSSRAQHLSALILPTHTTPQFTTTYRLKGSS